VEQSTTTHEISAIQITLSGAGSGPLQLSVTPCIVHVTPFLLDSLLKLVKVDGKAFARQGYISLENHTYNAGNTLFFA